MADSADGKVSEGTRGSAGRSVLGVDGENHFQIVHGQESNPHRRLRGSENVDTHDGEAVSKTY